MLLESIFYGIWILSLVFIACEIGQRVSNNCSSFENEIIEFDWYLYPIGIQRMLISLIIYAQKPVVFEFFGSMVCSREQFKKVQVFKFLYIQFIRRNSFLFNNTKWIYFRWSIMDILTSCSSEDHTNEAMQQNKSLDEIEDWWKKMGKALFQCIFRSSRWNGCL